MDPRRIFELVKFELARHFLTKKAWLALLAFALVWLMIYRYGISQAVSVLSDPNFEQFMLAAFGNLGLQSLLHWPDAEMAVYWLIALVTFPLFIIYLTSDQFVSDKERGTLRFIALRATRAEILLGRYFGHCLSAAALLAISIVGTLILIAFRDTNALVPALARALQFELLLLVNLMPFIALMTLLNTIARSSRMALIYVILLYTIGLMVLAILQGQLGLPMWLDYLIPGEPLDNIATVRPSPVTDIAWPLLQSGLLLALSFYKLQRSSL